MNDYLYFIGPCCYIAAWAEVKHSSIYTGKLDRDKEPWLIHKIVIAGSLSSYHQIRYCTTKNFFFVRKVCKF